MEPTSDAIVEAALSLPESERLMVVLRLLETMPADDLGPSLDDASLVDELDRRFTDRDGSVPWSELRAEN